LKRLTGVTPALLTPFDSRNRIDLSALRRLVRFLLASRVSGFYVNGSTGEWAKLSIEERKAVAETVISEVAGQVPVVIHVGHFDVSCALDLARHAYSQGADMVSSILPSPESSHDEIRGYYCSLASVGLPVIVYYLEQQAGRLNSAEDFLSEFGAIEGVQGVKYTGKDLYLMYCIHYLSEGKIKVWSGHDQMALAGLVMGAEGVIGANYNYLPELYVEMYEAFQKGDLQHSQHLQCLASQILWAVKKFGNRRAYRAALKLRGLDIGPCRPPVIPLSAQEMKELEAAIQPFSRYFGKITGADQAGDTGV